MAKKTKLTTEEQLFAHTYVENGENATKAVQEVFKVKGEGYARLKGHRLITKDNVSKEIEKIKISIADSIPDTLLVEKHTELLNVPRKIRRFVKGELMSEYEELDSFAVAKGLDMAYKIKGTYAPERIKHSGAVLFGDLEKLDNEQLARIAEGSES